MMIKFILKIYLKKLKKERHQLLLSCLNVEGISIAERTAMFKELRELVESKIDAVELLLKT